jgi:hypothetical protein
MRERKKRARRMLGGAFLALLALSVTACDFEVVNPGQITEDALDNPDAIEIILNGAIGDVEAAFDNLALHTALASGELKFSGTRSWLGFMGDGDMRPEDANESWQPAATARWTTVEAVRRLTELGASSDEIATANLYAGFIHRIMGETFCAAVFDGGEQVDRTEYFNRALSYFTAAESGSGDVGTAAKAGAAQTLMLLGRYGEAATKAAAVTDNEFVWYAYYTDTDESLLWTETQNQTQASVWQTPIGDLGEDGDPRTPFTIRDQSTAGGDPVYYRQEKYQARSDHHPLAKGWEMRLIEAENLLRTGDRDGAMEKINAIRTHFGLDPKTAADDAEAWEALAHERLVTLWLEARHLMDLDRLDDPFLTGRDACFPFSDAEINSNPNLAGCSGPACS